MGDFRNNYDGQLSLQQFKAAFPDLGLSDASYQWLYENLGQQEATVAGIYAVTKDDDLNIFASWENPLARGQFPTSLPQEVRLSGNAEELKTYLNANAATLNAADKAYVLKHIDTIEKTKKIQKEADDKLKSGEKRPEPVGIYTDEKGYVTLDTRQPAHQHTNMGCWSVAIQQLVASRGVKNVTQEDIRAYRPAENTNANIKNRQKDDAEGCDREDEIYNKDGGAVAAEVLDAQIAMAPNSMARLVNIAPYDPRHPEILQRGISKEQYDKNAREMIRQTVEKAIYIDHSPLIIKEPGHFLNIVGIKGDMLLINDPLKGRGTNGDRMREVHIDHFIDEMMGFALDEGVHLIWSSDVNLDKDGKIIGMPDSKVRMADNGDVILDEPFQQDINNNLPTTQKEGFMINRFGGVDGKPKGKDSPLTAGGLIVTEQAYIPRKLNADALRKEAGNRSPEDEDKLKKNADLYFKDVEELRDLKIDVVIDKGIEEAKKEPVVHQPQIPQPQVQMPVQQPQIQQPVQQSAVRQPVQPVMQEVKKEEPAWQEEKGPDKELSRHEAEQARIMTDALIDAKRVIGEQLELLRPTGIHDPQNSKAFNNMIKAMEEVQLLDVYNSPALILAKMSELAEAADNCKMEYSGPGSERAYKGGERATTIQVASINFKPIRDTMENAANSFSPQFPDVDKPLLETLRIRQREVADASTPEENLAASRDADGYAQKVELLAKAAAKHLKAFEGLTKSFGEDSEEYTAMVKAVSAVSDLGRASAPIEVVQAMDEMRTRTTAYIDKINRQGGGKHSTGSKRYSEAEAVLGTLDVSGIDRKMPEGFDISAPLLNTAKAAVSAELDQHGFVDIDKDEIPFTAMYTKEQFIETAQNLGWVCCMNDQRDDTWLSGMYDEADKKHVPKLDRLLYDIMSENVWDQGDRKAKSDEIEAAASELKEEGSLSWFTGDWIYNEYGEGELEQSINLIRKARIKEGYTDGSPKPYPRRDEPAPEPKSPYYKNLKDANGKTIGWTNEEFGLQKQWNDAITNSGDLKVRGRLTKEINRYNAKASVAQVRTGGEYQSENPGNVLVTQNNVFVNDMATTYAKLALRATKEEWLKLAAEQPNTPDGRVLKQFYEDNAFVCDPDIGNYMEAIARRPYLASLSVAPGGAPKFLGQRSDFTGEEAMEALRGKGPYMEGLPEEFRQDLLDPIMEYFHATSNEIRTEYERQRLALDGWDDEKEAKFAALLKKTHEETLAAQRKLMAMKDIGQYDRFLNNELDQTVGLRKDAHRDCYYTMGMMEGEIRALDNGWGSKDMLHMSILGGMGARIEKLRSEYLHEPDSSSEEFEKFKLYEEAYRELKGKYWELKNPGPEDKRRLTEDMEEFCETWKGLAPNNALSDYNQLSKLISEKREELFAGVPKKTDEEINARKQRIEAKREEIRRAQEGIVNECKPAEEPRSRETEAVLKKAEENGWTPAYKTYIEELLRLKYACERQLKYDADIEKKFGIKQDPENRKTKEELKGTLDKLIDKASGTKVIGFAGMQAVKDECENELKTYLGKSGLIWTHREKINTSDYKVGAIDKEIMKYTQKDLPPMQFNDLQGFNASVGSLAGLLPDDHKDKKELKELNEKIGLMLNDVQKKMKLKDNIISSEYYEEFKSYKDRVKEIAEGMAAGTDSKKEPVKALLTGHILHIAATLDNHIDLHSIENSYGRLGNMVYIAYQDVQGPKEALLAGKSPEEQKKIISEHEAKAAEDTFLFDAMEAGKECMQLSIKFAEDKYLAESEGREFDESGFRRQLRESLQKVYSKGKELLDKVNSPDFKYEDHPEFLNYTVKNLNENRALKGALKSIPVFTAMLDGGVPVEEMSWLDSVAKGYDKKVENIDRLGKERIPNTKQTRQIPIRPEFLALKEDMVRLADYADPAKNPHFTADHKKKMYDLVKAVETKAEQISKTAKDLKDTEKSVISENIAACESFYNAYTNESLRLLNGAGKNPEKLTALLTDYMKEGANPCDRKAAEQYVADLTKADKPVVQGGRIKYALSDGKLASLKAMYEKLGEQQMNAAERGDLEALKKAASLEKAVTAELKKYDGLIDGLNADGFIRQSHIESYEKKRNAMVAADGAADKDVAAKAAAADEKLHQTIAQIPAALQSDYELFTKSNADFMNRIKAQDDNMLKLNTFEDYLEQEKNKAKEILGRLNTMKVNEESDSRFFTDMRKSLENVAKLGPDKSPAEMIKAFGDLRTAAEAYHEEYDTVFRWFKSDNGLKRLDISAEIGNFAYFGQSNLGTHQIEKNKSIKAQREQYRTDVKERKVEKERRSVSLGKLLDEEKKAKPAKEKAPEKKNKVPEGRKSLEAAKKEKEEIKRSNTIK